ncbi:MAG TPA: hypothetical protein VHT27_11780 [Solirubrobacteraceae bacterium]|jgi:predicted lipoprotein with Yx(FWY)xxD motif|nr:hypothetical protein [Solirubrobacteraceae bacterium]
MKTNSIRAVALAGVVCAAGVFAIGGVATASAAGTAAASKRATVSLRSTRVGNILVTSSGFTLYEFTRDSTNKDVCQKIRGCTEAWPPLLTSSRPAGASGVHSTLIGSIKIAGGQMQVTYAGHPLYTYVGDTSKGQTSYVGVNALGGRWYALAANGALVK